MKLIRKLIVGISTLGLLIMTFVSATYAWFEINSRASVENFRFEVHGGLGFLVSIDNVNYYNDLSLEQLQKSMLVAYGNGEYRLANDGSEKLYQVTYGAGGQEVLNELSNAQINTLVNDKIKLLPTTSTNGRDLTDLYNSASSVSTGRFVQFNVYFRTQSRRVEDRFAYEIYLNGEDGVLEDGSVVEPTTITSSITNVPLSADMNATLPTTDGKYVTALKRTNAQNVKDTINVYSSNALRISITESTLREFDVLDTNNQPVIDEETGLPKKEKRYDVTDENATKIYELNDTVNTNTDLGSYATDYTGGKTDAELDAMITTQGTLVEDENLALYCSKFNAMYTYYNNLKPDAKIEHISYANKPQTLRDLSTKDAVTKVVSGDDPKLLTFRVWLEGWDADCFDGLTNAVKVRLAFGSRAVEAI